MQLLLPFTEAESWFNKAITKLKFSYPNATRVYNRLLNIRHAKRRDEYLGLWEIKPLCN
jgi:hypothetical protein